MTREELEHIIRASGDITDQYEFVVVGSQSILGAVPRPEDVFTVSMEVRWTSIPCRHRSWPTRSTAPSVKARSSMKPTATARKASARRRRACQQTGCSECIASRTAIPRNRIGYCLDVLDLFLAKAVAAREKDREFCIALLQYGYVNLEAALALVGNMPLDAKAQQTLRATMRRWVRSVI